MKDALGNLDSVLVLGGSSDIALATVKELGKSRTRNVTLAGRNAASLEQAAKELQQATPSAKVEVVHFDATDFESHQHFVDEQFAGRDFDLVIAAWGVLGDQDSDEKNPQQAVGVVQTNFTGAVSVLLPVSQKLEAQGHGTLVVLSSVAGERVRANNFIYGSSKAGLDGFAQGLGDSLAGSGVDVIIVRPGFVKSKMTSGMGEKPMSTTPEAVAQAIVSGVAKGQHTIWVPTALRFVMFAFRHLPRPIFRMIKQ